MVRSLYCIEGARAVVLFPASRGGGEKVFFSDGVVSEGGAVGARGVGDQFEVAAPVEVGVGFCEKEFGRGNDVRMWGCSGESDRGVLFGGIADAARATHRTVAAMSKRSANGRILHRS